VVFNLLSGDMYLASKDRGSFFNEKNLRLSDQSMKSKEDMVIGLNISGLTKSLFPSISELISSVNHIRHLGANALEVCYFAQGSIDAYIDIRGKIRAIDMAACYLIAKEAGGLIYDTFGNELNTDLSVESRMSYLAVPNMEIYNWIYSLIRV
jgi:myo-inositol-1(or 4)-monophosphatase